MWPGEAEERSWGKVRALYEHNPRRRGHSEGRVVFLLLFSLLVPLLGRAGREQKHDNIFQRLPRTRKKCSIITLKCTLNRREVFPRGCTTIMAENIGAVSTASRERGRRRDVTRWLADAVLKPRVKRFWRRHLGFFPSLKRPSLERSRHFLTDLWTSRPFAGQQSEGRRTTLPQTPDGATRQTGLARGFYSLSKHFKFMTMQSATRTNHSDPSIPPESVSAFTHWG